MNELDRRASDAGQQVSSTAGHLRKIADELRADDLSRPAAQLADRGAQTLEEVGRYLERSNGERLLADAERFGRERPWILATAGVALGLAGSRMLKASAARRADVDDYDDEATSAVTPSYTPAYTPTPKPPPTYRPQTGGTDFAATAAPVSSDAAPSKAAGQGTSPTATSYGSAGAYGAERVPPVADMSGTSNITKSEEAKRLTNADGS